MNNVQKYLNNMRDTTLNYSGAKEPIDTKARAMSELGKTISSMADQGQDAAGFMKFQQQQADAHAYKMATDPIYAKEQADKEALAEYVKKSNQFNQQAMQIDNEARINNANRKDQINQQIGAIRDESGLPVHPAKAGVQVEKEKIGNNAWTQVPTNGHTAAYEKMLQGISAEQPNPQIDTINQNKTNALDALEQALGNKKSQIIDTPVNQNNANNAWTTNRDSNGYNEVKNGKTYAQMMNDAIQTGIAPKANDNDIGIMAGYNDASKKYAMKMRNNDAEMNSATRFLADQIQPDSDYKVSDAENRDAQGRLLNNKVDTEVLNKNIQGFHKQYPKLDNKGYDKLYELDQTKAKVYGDGDLTKEGINAKLKELDASGANMTPEGMDQEARLRQLLPHVDEYNELKIRDNRDNIMQQMAGGYNTSGVNDAGKLNRQHDKERANRSKVHKRNELMRDAIKKTKDAYADDNKQLDKKMTAELADVSRKNKTKMNQKIGKKNSKLRDAISQIEDKASNEAAANITNEVKNDQIEKANKNIGEVSKRENNTRREDADIKYNNDKRYIEAKARKEIRDENDKKQSLKDKVMAKAKENDQIKKNNAKYEDRINDAATEMKQAKTDEEIRVENDKIKAENDKIISANKKDKDSRISKLKTQLEAEMNNTTKDSDSKISKLSAKLEAEQDGYDASGVANSKAKNNVSANMLEKIENWKEKQGKTKEINDKKAKIKKDKEDLAQYMKQKSNTKYTHNYKLSDAVAQKMWERDGEKGKWDAEIYDDDDKSAKGKLQKKIFDKLNEGTGADGKGNYYSVDKTKLKDKVAAQSKFRTDDVNAKDIALGNAYENVDIAQKNKADTIEAQSDAIKLNEANRDKLDTEAEAANVELKQLIDNNGTGKNSKEMNKLTSHLATAGISSVDQNKIIQAAIEKGVRPDDVMKIIDGKNYKNGNIITNRFKDKTIQVDDVVKQIKKSIGDGSFYKSNGDSKYKSKLAKAIAKKVMVEHNSKTAGETIKDAKFSYKHGYSEKKMNEILGKKLAEKKKVKVENKKIIPKKVIKPIMPKEPEKPKITKEETRKLTHKLELKLSKMKGKPITTANKQSIRGIIKKINPDASDEELANAVTQLTKSRTHIKVNGMKKLQERLEQQALERQIIAEKQKKKKTFKMHTNQGWM